MHARIPIWRQKPLVTNYGNAILRHLQRDWRFHLVQSGFVVFAIYWWWHLPAPGYAIGVFALLAALMNFDVDMNAWDKLTWTFVMVLFLVFEFRAIKNFNQVEYARRVQENSEFRHIAVGVEGATTRLENLKSGQENSRTETAVGFQKTFSLLDLIGHSKSPEDKAAAARIQRDLLKRFLSEITVDTLKTTTHDVIYRLMTLHDNVLHAEIRIDNARSMRQDTATMLLRQNELKEAEDNYGSSKVWSDEVIPLRDELIKRHLDDYAKGLQDEIDRHDGKIR